MSTRSAPELVYSASVEQQLQAAAADVAEQRTRLQVALDRRDSLRAAATKGLSLTKIAQLLGVSRQFACRIYHTGRGRHPRDLAANRD